MRECTLQYFQVFTSSPSDTLVVQCWKAKIYILCRSHMISFCFSPLSAPHNFDKKFIVADCHPTTEHQVGTTEYVFLINRKTASGPEIKAEVISFSGRKVF